MVNIIINLRNMHYLGFLSILQCALCQIRTSSTKLIQICFQVDHRHREVKKSEVNDRLSLLILNKNVLIKCKVFENKMLDDI